MTWFLVILLILLFAFSWLLLCTKNLPPGPMGLPFFGYALSIKSPLFQTTHKLGKIYGKLFSFTAYGRNVIVINDYSVLKIALINRKEFSGRTTLFVNGVLAENCGVSNYDGRSVIIKKRFLKTFLKMTDDIESITDIETDKLVGYIQNLSSKSINSRLLFNKAVCNIIWQIVFGERFDYSNLRALANVERVALNNSDNDIISFRQFLPSKFSSTVLRSSTLQNILHLNEVLNRYRNVIGFIKNALTNAKLRYGFDTHPFEMENENKKPYLSEKETLRLIFELFAAGTDTIILTMQWSMLLLAIHAKIQENMRQEINQFLIPNKDGKIVVSWSDRNKLRYCQQVISEVHRYASVTPLALPHRVMESCTLKNYHIPADSIILIGVYSIHNDPDLWNEPHQFNPNRFDNKSLTENIIPFSLGSRSCPGAVIAQVEIFTMLLNIITNFKIIPKKKDLRLEDLGIGSSGLTRGPLYHEIIFQSIP